MSQSLKRDVFRWVMSLCLSPGVVFLWLYAATAFAFDPFYTEWLWNRVNESLKYERIALLSVPCDALPLYRDEVRHTRQVYLTDDSASVRLSFEGIRLSPGFGLWWRFGTGQPLFFTERVMMVREDGERQEINFLLENDVENMPRVVGSFAQQDLVRRAVAWNRKTHVVKRQRHPKQEQEIKTPQ